MTTSTTISELERQREERHRLLDQEYDQRIKFAQQNCRHEYGHKMVWVGLIMFRVPKYKCKHCGYEIPT